MPAERMSGFAMKNGHLVASREEALDEEFADKKRPADYENAHLCRVPFV